MQRLRCCFRVPSLCLQLLILTAARSNEARGARWSEIDLDHAVWTIPATRMKGAREHRVPLSDAALSVLRKMAEFGTEGFVFPGLKAASTLSDVTLVRLVDVVGGEGVTVHGFRSTFRDWCGEMTNYPRELAELALAHRTFVDEIGQTVGKAVELAYRRGDQLERRRRLMADWATFCERPMIPAEVVAFRAAT